MEFTSISYEHEKGTHTLFPSLCKGCGLCIIKCPQEALSWSDLLGAYGNPAVISNDNCNLCGICQIICPDCAIRVDKKEKGKS